MIRQQPISLHLMYLVHLTCIIVLLSSALKIWASPSEEQTNQESRQALQVALENSQELAFKAQLAAEKSDFSQSIQLYKQAYTIYPDVEFLFAIASLYRRVPNACKEELDSWDRFLTQCQSCPMLVAGKNRLTDSLSRCLSTLTVVCPSSQLIFINQQLKGKTPQTISSLTPGNYQIQCGSGQTALTQKIKLNFQENKTVTFTDSQKQNPPPKINEESVQINNTRSITALMSTSIFTVIAVTYESKSSNSNTGSVYFSETPPSEDESSGDLIKTTSWILAGSSLLWFGYEIFFHSNQSNKASTQASHSNEFNAWIPALTPTGLIWEGKF